MRIKTNRAPRGINGIGIIGKVAVGAKGSNGYPKGLDHFVFNVDDKRKSLIAESIGDEPKVLLINIPHEDCVQHYWELRSKSGDFIAKCDEETIVVAKDEGVVKYSMDQLKTTSEKARAKLEATHGTKFKECVSLHFLLNNYPEKGLWLLQTRGVKTSIDNIVSVFDANGVGFYTLSVERVKGKTVINKSKTFNVIKLIKTNGHNDTKLID